MAITNSGILITRPQHQAQNLYTLLKNHGLNPILFPTIVIEPIPDQKLLSRQILQLDNFDIAIFCSANAVWQTEKLLKKHWQQLPKNLIFASIGAATKKALEELGYQVQLCPTHTFSSEALLASPELQQINQRRIIIFSGKNSRDLLPETLKKRGAIVTQLECYRRVPAIADPKPIIALMQKGQVQFVVCSSNEALSNLFAILDISGQMLLRDIQIVGVSDRITPLALLLGCRKEPLIAAQASDEALVQLLLHGIKANK